MLRFSTTHCARWLGHICARLLSLGKLRLWDRWRCALQSQRPWLCSLRSRSFRLRDIRFWGHGLCGLHLSKLWVGHFNLWTLLFCCSLLWKFWLACVCHGGLRLCGLWLCMLHLCRFPNCGLRLWNLQTYEFSGLLRDGLCRAHGLGFRFRWLRKRRLCGHGFNWLCRLCRCRFHIHPLGRLQLCGLCLHRLHRLRPRSFRFHRLRLCGLQLGRLIGAGSRGGRGQTCSSVAGTILTGW
mmetsp:Transcript_52486/g.149591  ORF Transcript_52486/g.149591 Transcript_52486/m.149591 type:complete len:239 (-) Transcript_52486:298-1014(-)